MEDNSDNSNKNNSSVVTIGTAKSHQPVSICGVPIVRIGMDAMETMQNLQQHAEWY